MKEYKKEIIICILAVAITGSAIWYFNRSLQSEKEITPIDLYSIVASDPVCILQINRSTQLKRIIKDDPLIKKAITGIIPDLFISIFTNQGEMQSSLVTFHRGDAVFYTAGSTHQIKEIEKQYICKDFSLYNPQTYEKYGLEFIFYPDTANRFLGYFTSKGLLVASYNRKLLEEVALLYSQRNNSTPSATLDSIRVLTDRNSPANILIKSDLFDFNFHFEEDSFQFPVNHWFGNDMLVSEKNICFFTTFSYSLIPPQFTDTLAMEFTRKLERFIPDLIINYHLQEEEDGYLYTGCSSFSTE